MRREGKSFITFPQNLKKENPMPSLAAVAAENPPYLIY